MIFNLFHPSGSCISSCPRRRSAGWERSPSRVSMLYTYTYTLSPPFARVIPLFLSKSTCST
ncbi:MAG: hypothetical protein SPL12_06580, partial [Bacteroidales bacterium]|nr:hypothetical protein [Bacteroidales bacterium]